MIGVSGLRGIVGTSLTPGVASQYAAGFAAWLKRSGTPADGKAFVVVVGRDSRPSGAMVRDAAVAALTASGIAVVDLDIVSTPGVALMVKYLGADAGMVITASHNPIQWNGIKLLTRDAMAPAPNQALEIKASYERADTSYVPVSCLIQAVKNTQTHARHVQKTLDYVDVNGISCKRFKVVVDSVNGAGCVTSATLLSKLGCQVIHLNSSPDGYFPHEPEPTEANLTQLAAEVKRQKAHIGFAQDPDADRLAIVDENGVYIGEEYTPVLAAKYMLARRPGATVLNLSSSRMMDDVAAQLNSRVVRTAVGEVNVVLAMLRENSPIGGEGNGGVIDTRIVPGRDSLVGMAYVLQLMAETGKSVSQLVNEIPRYVIIKTKFPCRREDANKAVEALKAEFAKEKVDVQDGIRIDWEKAWVHARPSNTEPIMRIIAEAPTREMAQEKVDICRKIVDRTLGQ